jgi:DNA polymerase-3 subunit alpha
MSNLDFCHCHVHSVYSILDGINKLDQLVARCKELGMSACALTDHGNLHGMVDFYKECKKGGIKPIIGIECYITADPDGLEDNSDKTRDNHHCVLIAQNNKGLANLFWLLSNGNLNNFYYKPRINIEVLKARSEGLIATSACVGGWVAQQGVFDTENKVFLDPDGKAYKAAKDLHDVFQGRFFLEIQDQDMWEQTAFNKWIVDLSTKEKIPTLISADAHYLRAEDRNTHAMIMAQQLKKTIHEYESGSDMKYGGGFYIKSPQEMLDGAIKHGSEQAFWNSMEIAKMCNVDIELGKYKMPSFDITKASDYDEFKRSKASTKFECDPRSR